MNTKKTLIFYAADTLILLIDFFLMNHDIEYALLFLVICLLPILAVATLMTLLSVILWKKSVQLSKDDIFFFVAYNTVIPYGCFSVAFLVIMLVCMIF